MPLIIKDGKLLVAGNKLATSEDCCCTAAEDCTNCQSGTTQTSYTLTVASTAFSSGGTQYEGIFILTQVSACLFRYVSVDGWDWSMSIGTLLSGIFVQLQGPTGAVVYRHQGGDGAHPFNCNFSGYTMRYQSGSVSDATVNTVGNQLTIDA